MLTDHFMENQLNVHARLKVFYGGTIILVSGYVADFREVSNPNNQKLISFISSFSFKTSGADQKFCLRNFLPPTKKSKSNIPEIN